MPTDVQSDIRAYHVIRMSPSIRGHQINETIRSCWPIVEVTNTPFAISIGGYDDDTRELWEIPKVIEFCQRIVESGLISMLVGKTDPSGAFGAVMIYAVANRIIKKGGAGWTGELGADGREGLRQAIIRGNQILDSYQ